jgi:hypothetical protein
MGCGCFVIASGSEAIHRTTWTEWIASSLALLAMTAKSVIEPKVIVL